MEDLGALALGPGQILDLAAFLGSRRIALRCHHHGQRGFGGKDRGAGLGEIAARGAHHQLGEIILQPHHQHLAFGIAEAGVIFDQLRSGVGQHQPGEQHSAIGRALGGHGGDGWPDNLVHHLLLQLGGEDRGRAIGAHAAGIRPDIAVADALVVLRGAERNDILAVGDREEARFLAGQKFLDHHFRPGLAKAAVEHVADRRLGFVAGFGDDHALAGGQTIGLDHHRNGKSVERGQRIRRAGCPDIAGGRDMGAGAQVLGKAFRAFQLRRCLVRPEHENLRDAQAFGEAIDQRRFRPDHDQIDVMLAAEQDHRAVIGDVQRDQFGMLGNAGIAGSSIEFLERRGLRQLPRQGMFAATRTDQQDIHGRFPFTRREAPSRERAG